MSWKVVKPQQRLHKKPRRLENSKFFSFCISFASKCSGKRTNLVIFILFSIGYFESQKPKEPENQPTTPPTSAPVFDPNRISRIHEIQNEADFNAHVKNAGNKLVVVKFHASSCGPCKTIAWVLILNTDLPDELLSIYFCAWILFHRPHLEELAEKHQDKTYMIKVDVDRVPMDKYQVVAMPTFIFLKNGQQVHRFSGAHKDKIQAAIQTHA